MVLIIRIVPHKCVEYFQGMLIVSIPEIAFAYSETGLPGLFLRGFVG
jgi:hypothetical protein